MMRLGNEPLGSEFIGKKNRGCALKEVELVRWWVEFAGKEGLRVINRQRLRRKPLIKHLRPKETPLN